MTVSDSIISWLKGYENNRIDTGIQSDSVMSYALSKEPTVNVKRYVSGREVHTEYYQFTARLDTQTNSDRVDNGAWFEDLESWISEKNKEGNFPNITDATVSRVEVSSSFYIGRTDENTSIYSITIAITYSKGD